MIVRSGTPYRSAQPREKGDVHGNELRPHEFRFRFRGLAIGAAAGGPGAQL